PVASPVPASKAAPARAPPTRPILASRSRPQGVARRWHRQSLPDQRRSPQRRGPSERADGSLAFLPNQISAPPNDLSIRRGLRRPAALAPKESGPIAWEQQRRKDSGQGEDEG